jgi:HSP20 family protein
MTDKRKIQPSENSVPRESPLAMPDGSGLASFFDGFFQPFDEFMRPFFRSDVGSLFPKVTGYRQPNVDVQDRGDHFSITAELPGFSKEDVEVKVSPNAVELKAKSESGGEEKEGHRGAVGSYFHTHLSLPERVDVDRVDGTMKNGILELRIPKVAGKRDIGARRVDLK